ncbi:MAG: hypothetical protein KBT08_00375 [Bacteroidales bacterium]|nr:hypothetical protein [Candidatus Cryptobacteroides onthequi]
MKKLFTFMAITAAMLLSEVRGISCTSVIISGRITPDGRPLMWKNRDTGAAENVMAHFPAEDGCYSYMGIVNSGLRKQKSIWIGTNSQGFSIMNTVSYNIAPAEDSTLSGANGTLMARALKVCADMEDFEHFLDTLPKPWKVATNYGVIDAKGNAAYYEINSREYFKYDVNDTTVAPQGYIVRTNFSFNGRPMKQGKGHARYMEANRQMEIACRTGQLTPAFIFDRLARSYANGLTGVDYRDPSFDGKWAFEHDIITRFKTTCSVVIQGVRPDENPELTTMWTIVGYPGTTPAMPAWEAGGQDGISYLMRADEKGISPLSHNGYELKVKAYEYDIDDQPEQLYFRWDMLWNKEGTGITQKMMSLESKVTDVYSPYLEKWRRKGHLNLKQLAAANAAAETILSAAFDN